MIFRHLSYQTWIIRNEAISTKLIKLFQKIVSTIFVIVLSLLFILFSLLITLYSPWFIPYCLFFCSLSLWSLCSSVFYSSPLNIYSLIWIKFNLDKNLKRRKFESLKIILIIKKFKFVNNLSCIFYSFKQVLFHWHNLTAKKNPDVKHKSFFIQYKLINIIYEK